MARSGYTPVANLHQHSCPPSTGRLGQRGRRHLFGSADRPAVGVAVIVAGKS